MKTTSAVDLTYRWLRSLGLTSEISLAFCVAALYYQPVRIYNENLLLSFQLLHSSLNTIQFFVALLEQHRLADPSERCVILFIGCKF